MRVLIDDISPEAKRELRTIANPKTSSRRYAEAMQLLGQFLAKRIMLSALSSDARGLLVCTAEDADSLAQGLFDELSSTTGDLKLACFWNLRTRPATKHDQTIDLDVAPIVRRYEEPSVSRPDFVVIAKSVISSGCVVRHNLLDIIDRKKPKRIFVASPVMLEGADDRLRSEFPSVIAKRMEFIYFAIDNAKDESGMLRPGIGGSIYERLGSQRNAKEFTPKLVLARRLSLNGF